MLSGISGAGGFERLQQLLDRSGVDKEAIQEKLQDAGFDPSQFGGGPPGGLREAAGEKITAALEAQGIDEETRAAIKADVQAVIEESEGSREETRAAIQGVLEEHGVDTEALKASVGERGEPRPAGFGSFGGGLLEALEGYESTGSESSDAIETLLQSLFATDEEA